MNGFNHFKNASGLTQYAASKNVPMPKVSVYLTGVMLLVGGLGVIFGVFIEMSLWFIIIFLILTSLKMHGFWKVSDPAQKMSEQTNFMKNIALAGAALMMLMIPLPWAFSIMIGF